MVQKRDREHQPQKLSSWPAPTIWGGGHEGFVPEGCLSVELRHVRQRRPCLRAESDGPGSHAAANHSRRTAASPSFILRGAERTTPDGALRVQHAHCKRPGCHGRRRLGDASRLHALSDAGADTSRCRGGGDTRASGRNGAGRHCGRQASGKASERCPAHGGRGAGAGAGGGPDAAHGDQHQDRIQGCAAACRACRPRHRRALCPRSRARPPTAPRVQA